MATKLKRVELGTVATLPCRKDASTYRVRIISVRDDNDVEIEKYIDIRQFVSRSSFEGYTKEGITLDLGSITDIQDIVTTIASAVKNLTGGK